MTSVKSNCLPSKKTRRIGVDAARWSRQPMGEATAEGRAVFLEVVADGGRRFGGGGRWVRQPPKGGWIIVAPGWLAYLGLVVKGIIYRRRAVV